MMRRTEIQITQGEEEAQIKTVRKLDKKTIERQKREAKNKLYSQFVQVKFEFRNSTVVYIFQKFLFLS